jgi:hypothetical protein
MVQGQALRGRVSLQMKGSSTQESVAPGLHLDAQLPVAGGFSVAAGGGFSAFLLRGRTKATYSFDPELTLNITLPSRSLGATTIFGGGGYHVPFGYNPEGSGPTLHLGVGRIWALRESTLFVDLVPTVVVREKTVAVLMPIRAGVVF